MNIKTVQLAHSIYLDIPYSSCNCETHYTKLRRADEYGESLYIPKDDLDVCNRERAWRHYCKLREAYKDEAAKSEVKPISRADQKYLESIGSRRLG